MPIAKDETAALLQTEHWTMYCSVKNGHYQRQSIAMLRRPESRGEMPTQPFLLSDVPAATSNNRSNNTHVELDNPRQLRHDTASPCEADIRMEYSQGRAHIWSASALPMILSPVVRYLKDNVGVCYPARPGLLAIAPLL